MPQALSGAVNERIRRGACFALERVEEGLVALYTFAAEDGSSFGTFSDSTRAKAEAFLGVPVVVTWERTPKGNLNLVGIESDVDDAS